MIPITINHQAITQSSPLVKGGAPEGGQTVRRKEGKDVALSLLSKTYPWRCFLLSPYVINNSVLN